MTDLPTRPSMSIIDPELLVEIEAMLRRAYHQGWSDGYVTPSRNNVPSSTVEVTWRVVDGALRPVVTCSVVRR